MGSSAASPSFMWAVIFALVTALFWGTYGPLLQQGHHGMGTVWNKEKKAYEHVKAGRFRPFICVGIAYLLVAVILPIFLMPFVAGETPIRADGSPGGLLDGWTFGGVTMSIVAGAVGAIGAFGVIMAVNAGGPPSTVYVMPIIFGCAPIVNTIVSMSINKTFGNVSPFFFIGLMMVILGVSVVLYTAPKPGAKAPATGDIKSTAH